MSASNGRRPSPAITLERGERDLERALNELPGVELVLWLRYAVVRQDGGLQMHAYGRGSVAEHRLEAITPEVRLALAGELAHAAARLAGSLELQGESYRCPICGATERIPQAELDDPAIAGRYCEGLLRRHAPALLIPDPHVRPTA